MKKLREKNEGLKAELKSEQEKNQELEEQLEKLKEEMLNQSSAQGDDKSINPHQLLSLTSEIKRLESEKEKLEVNNSKLQEHISCLKRSVSEVEEVWLDEYWLKLDIVTPFWREVPRENIILYGTARG